MHIASRYLAAAMVATTMVPALAVTTTYTNSAAFLAGVAPGAYTNTFSGPADAALSYSYSGGGFAYTVTAQAAGFGDDVYLSGTFIGNYYSNRSLTVTFTSGNVRAIGGDFFISDVNDAFKVQPVVLTLSDGTVESFTSASQAAAFRGFTSTVSITSLTMSAPGSTNYNTIDNLVVGTVTAVPEVASWALMGVGLAGVLLAGQRRRRG